MTLRRLQPARPAALGPVVLLGLVACSSPPAPSSAAHSASASPVENVAEVETPHQDEVEAPPPPPPEEVGDEGDLQDEDEGEDQLDDELTDEDLAACVPYESLAEICRDMHIPASACRGEVVAPPSHGFDEILRVHYEADVDVGSSLSDQTRTTELVVLRMGRDLWLVDVAQGHHGGGYEYVRQSLRVSALPEGLAIFRERTEGSTEAEGWSETSTRMVLVNGVHGAPRRRLSRSRDVPLRRYQRHPLDARARRALSDCSATRCEPQCWGNDPEDEDDL